MSNPPPISQDISEDAIHSWIEPETFFSKTHPAVPDEALQFPPGIPKTKAEKEEILHEKDDVAVSTKLSTSPTKVFVDNDDHHESDEMPSVGAATVPVSKKENAREIETITQSTDIHQSPAKVQDNHSNISVDTAPHPQEKVSLPSPTQKAHQKLEISATVSQTTGDLHPAPSPIVTKKDASNNVVSPHTIVDASSPLKRQSKLPSPKREKEHRSMSLVHEAPGVLLHDNHHDHEDLPVISKPHKSVRDDFREHKLQAEQNRIRVVATDVALSAAASSFESAKNAYRALEKVLYEGEKKKSSDNNIATKQERLSLEHQIKLLRVSVDDEIRRQEYLLRFRDSITTKRQISTLREELEAYFENISRLETSRDDAVERLSRERIQTEDRSNRVIENMFMLTARDNRVEMKHKHWLAAAAVYSAVTRQGKREVKTETKRILQDTERQYRVSLERFRGEHRATFPYLNAFELEKWRQFSTRQFGTRQRELTYIQNQCQQHDSGKLRNSIRAIVSNFQSIIERLMLHMQHLRHRKRSPVNLSESKIHAAFLTTTDAFLPETEGALILYERHYRDILRRIRMG